MNRYVLICAGIVVVCFIGFVTLKHMDSSSVHMPIPDDVELVVEVDPYEFHSNEVLSDADLIEATVSPELIVVSGDSKVNNDGFGKSILEDVGYGDVSEHITESTNDGIGDVGVVDDSFERDDVVENPDVVDVYKTLNVGESDVAVIESMVAYFKKNRDDPSSGVVGVGEMRLTEKAARDMSKKFNIEYREDLLRDEYYNKFLGVAYYLHLKELNNNSHFVINAYVYGPTGIFNYTSERLNYVTELSKMILSDV